jgi:hypothetical protein
VSALAELFADGDYRFHLTLRRGEPRDFFQSQDPTGRTLQERALWLEESPARYAQLTPEGAPLLREFAELAASWGGAPVSSAIELGKTFEPDVLFLSADEQGRFILRGGILCFPTGWALEEKLGHPLDAIHGVVPGLNSALGSPIHQFLSKLKPGGAFFRDNWGLAATDELNLHPTRSISPPSSPVWLERLWLRVERQILVALPRTRGIVFGIRIELHRLDEIAKTPAAGGLARALETMPADLAAYKRIDEVRGDVIRLLR